MENIILIVDGQPIVRYGLRREILKVLPDAELLESSSVSAAKHLLSNRDDVSMVIMDISLSGALFFTPKIRELSPPTKVIIFSDKDDLEVVNLGVKHGANGFVSKSLGVGDIIGDMLLYLDGTLDLQKLLNGGCAHPALPPEPANNAPPSVVLNKFTRREREIAQLVSLGMSNLEISKTVRLAEGTVKNYLSVIFGKAGVKNRSQLISAIA